MVVNMFDDLEVCANWIKNASYKKVVLQIPDDLMVHSVEITTYLQKNSNAFLYIIGDSAYENCCNDKLSADHIEADACVHFGHACLSCTSQLPTFYVFPKQNLSIYTFCNKFYQYFGNEAKNILLFYDISFAHLIEQLYGILKTKYENLIISKLNCTSNIQYTSSPLNGDHNTTLGRYYDLPPGYRTEMYDAVFLGPNDKTLMTLSMSTPFNSWHYYDGLEFNEYNIIKSTWLKRRSFLIEKIKDAQIFGILIASLNIENYLNIVDMLKTILKTVNKKTYLFSVGKISPTKLANFQEVDIFVAVACPESSLIDSKEYFKPIVTPFEVDLAFNDARTFSPLHAIDFKQMLPGGLNYEEFKPILNNDISLTSGKMRSYDENDHTADNTALAQKSLGTLMNSQIDTNFLESRTWTGLEQKLGETSVNLAVNGREGVPVNYVNELL